MTPEAVEKALDEVRPYLIADGGNVEVRHCSQAQLQYRVCACHFEGSVAFGLSSIALDPRLQT